MNNQIVLNEADIKSAIKGMAKQIAGRGCVKPLAIVGILSQGDIIARRIAAELKKLGCHAEYGAIDISLYRDDISRQIDKPSLRSSDLPFSTDDMRVVIVDDVLYTGRTIRAALNALFDYGRPGSVELACLIDRGGRELPIQADYVGHTIPEPGRKIIVHLKDEFNDIKQDSVKFSQP